MTAKILPIRPLSRSYGAALYAVETMHRDTLTIPTPPSKRPVRFPLIVINGCISGTPTAPEFQTFGAFMAKVMSISLPVVAVIYLFVF